MGAPLDEGDGICCGGAHDTIVPRRGSDSRATAPHRRRHREWPASASGPRVVTFAVLTGRFAVTGTHRTLSRDNCSSMGAFADILDASPAISPAMARDALRAAFAAWEGVADIAFRQVFDLGKANIIVGATNSHRGRAFANLTYAGPGNGPSSENGHADKALGGSRVSGGQPSALPRQNARPAHIERAYVCLSPRVRWKIGFDSNLKIYDLRYTFTHEIGHAIGLDHPGKSGAVMGYRYDESVEGLQQSDIEAVRALYGPRRSREPLLELQGSSRK